MGGANELVELQMNGGGVAVLGALNQEHHQERDDGGARVDDELPGVREAEERTRNGPDDDDRERGAKGGRLASQDRHAVSEVTEPVPLLAGGLTRFGPLV